MRGTGRPGSEVTAVGTYPAICLVAALLALTGTLLVRWFPLPSFESGEFLSSYGTVDNRRVLLTYAVCVAAVFAAPRLCFGVAGCWVVESMERSTKSFLPR